MSFTNDGLSYRSMTDTVALYCRLSPRPDGQYEGVDRQEQWGRSYAERMWPGLPVRVFADAGISAANGEARPGYEALRDAIARGEVAHLWCVEQSRLERQEVGWFLLVAELAKVGIDEVHTDRGGVVRVGDAAAGIQAVLAADEVRKLRRRVNDALDSLAAEGRPGVGHHIAYRHGRNEAGEATLTIIPEMAEVVREAAARVLAGWSLSAVARDLEARGVATRKGGRWGPGNVKGMLCSPIVAGRRVHRGEIVGVGNWPPVLDEDTWRQLRARLVDDQPTSRPAHRYLLSGIAVCGRCGHGLTGRTRKDRDGAYYFCAPPAGCARLAMRADDLDHHVVASLLAELDRPAFRAAVAADEHEERRAGLVRDLGALEDQRAELGRLWVARTIDSAGWAAARQTLDAQQSELTAALAAVPPPVDSVDPATVREGWELMTLDERRQVLDLFIESVTVASAAPGVHKVDLGRVSIVWR